MPYHIVKCPLNHQVGHHSMGIVPSIFNTLIKTSIQYVV